MKRDALVDTAQSALEWFEEHKQESILFVVILLVVVAVGVGSILIYQHRQQEASVAFGSAMDIYSAPVAQPGVPQQPGVRVYPTSAARAKAANAQFAKIADDFSSTTVGKNALYFSALTDLERGNSAAGETTLKKVADKGDKNLAALANLALANLYRQNGRTGDAIALLNRLANHPSATVPASEAKLQLASIYEKSNPEQAKLIYSQLKDKDAKTAAGQIATQKLAQLK
jgi:predicted negative regulator of RcsB-dependent stress response